jgi:hypothetical protein
VVFEVSPDTSVFLLERVMAEKKDPSIYDDRSNIGSSEELDEYGVWVKSEPQDLSSAMPEMEELPDFDDDLAGGVDLPDFDDELAGGADVPDFADAELPAETADFAAEVEFEEIPEDSDLPRGQSPIEVDKDGFTEVSMNDFLDDEELESSDRDIDIGDLDSIPDIAEEVSEPVKAPAAAASGVSAAASGGELSTQLLMKIAEELSSIKKELSSLKSELSSVRSAQAENPEAHGASGGGFFDEEDDEKIALTGDELDNILNTANFTEEAGSGASVEEDFGSFENLNDESAAENDLLSGKPGIIEDAADAPAGQEEPLEFEDNLDSVKPAGGFNPEPVEEINDDFDVSLDLSEDLTTDLAGAENVEIPDDGLGSLREEGFNPMTQVEGDTSYLEEDPLASIPEDEQIDFSTAVIDEPDLSSQITENPVEDPAIENISIDLDMEEPAGLETESGDFTLEHEDTMEIPVTEEPLIDDFFPISEPADTQAGLADGVPSDDTFEPFVPEAEAPGESDVFAPEAPVSAENEAPAAMEPVLPPEAGDGNGIPSNLKQELKTVLSYMDQLLESLPEDKIEEFAKSEYFDTYKKLFEELGLV